MPNIRWLLSLFTSVHRFLYRATNGRIGARLRGTDMLLLETVGRKSGKQRTIPLLYVRDEPNWLLVASNAGDEKPPAWWLNLKSRPEAAIQVRSQRFEVRAREAGPEEEERLWPRLIQAYPGYEDYKRGTSRKIPIVVLEQL